MTTPRAGPAHDPTAPDLFPWNDLELSVPALLRRTARRYPDRPAVRSRGRLTTWAELDATSDRLARTIAPRVPGGAPVALLLEHDTPMIATALAVLGAGGIVLVLDPRDPPARLSWILDDAEASLVLADARYLTLAREVAGRERTVLDVGDLEPAPGAAAPGPVAAGAPGFLAYSSGTTGTPKGILWDHRGMLHVGLAHVSRAGIGPDDRLSLVHALGGNASFRHLFGALATGAAVLPFALPEEGLDRLGPWLAADEVSVLHCSASTFRHFAAALPAGALFPALRLVWIANEPMVRGDVELFRARFPAACRLVFGLGITEAGAVCDDEVGAPEAFDGDRVPLGRAVPGKEILLLEDDRSPVPPGAVGEIAVRSEYLALGYWRRPDLDRAAFLPDPGGGPARIYLTGDLGRILPDGRLLLLGRKDARLRLHGHFVDPVEIERALLEHPALADAAVAVREDQPGDQRLVAYVVARPGADPTVTGLRARLEGRLPAGEVPAVFVLMREMPRTANGKVDRRALPPPGRERPPLGHPPVPPRTPLEQQLAALWADVLGLDAVGVHDEFLALGGHSLLAGRLVARVRETLGVEMSVRTLLESPTVADMTAAVLAEHLRAAAEDERGARILDALAEDVKPSPPAPDTG